MSFVSQNDESVLEPLTEKIVQDLSLNPGLKIDRFRLREFIFLRAKKEILSQHPDWAEDGKLQPGALQRQSQVNAIVDLQNITPQMIEEIISFFNQPEPEPEPPPAYPVFQVRIREKVIIKDIDQKVGPFGKTRLHLAVDAQDLTEIKRLVEEEKANVHVKDNAGKTPWDRANLADFTEIASYLSNF